MVNIFRIFGEGTTEAFESLAKRVFPQLGEDAVQTLLQKVSRELTQEQTENFVSAIGKKASGEVLDEAEERVLKETIGDLTQEQARGLKNAFRSDIASFVKATTQEVRDAATDAVLHGNRPTGKTLDPLQALEEAGVKPKNQAGAAPEAPKAAAGGAGAEPDLDKLIKLAQLDEIKARTAKTRAETPKEAPATEAAKASTDKKIAFLDNNPEARFRDVRALEEKANPEGKVAEAELKRVRGKADKGFGEFAFLDFIDIGAQIRQDLTDPKRGLARLMKVNETSGKAEEIVRPEGMVGKFFEKTDFHKGYLDFDVHRGASEASLSSKFINAAVKVHKRTAFADVGGKAINPDSPLPSIPQVMEDLVANNKSFLVGFLERNYDKAMDAGDHLAATKSLELADKLSKSTEDRTFIQQVFKNSFGASTVSNIEPSMKAIARAKAASSLGGGADTDVVNLSIAGQFEHWKSKSVEAMRSIPYVGPVAIYAGGLITKAGGFVAKPVANLAAKAAGIGILGWGAYSGYLEEKADTVRATNEGKLGEGTFSYADAAYSAFAPWKNWFINHPGWPSRQEENREVINQGVIPAYKPSEAKKDWEAVANTDAQSTTSTSPASAPTKDWDAVANTDTPSAPTTPQTVAPTKDWEAVADGTAASDLPKPTTQKTR